MVVGRRCSSVDDLNCVTWGELDTGRHAHMDCVVVVTREKLPSVTPEQARRLAAGPLPIVCPCECHVCKRAWWEKLIILASSLPIAFLCNTLRLAATAVCFTIIKGEEVEQWFHDWAGYAMMPLALALVVGELWLLARLTTSPREIEPAIISRQHTPHLPDLTNRRAGV